MWDSLKAAFATWTDPEVVGPLAMTWAGNILAALAIFVIGRWIAARIAGAVEVATEKAHKDHTLARFLRNIIYLGLLIMVVLTAVGRLGVPTTNFLAILGAAGLAIGLALKDSLGNFSSGVMLVFFRPFKSGDYVEAAGVAGIIDEISMFSTSFRTLDNRVVIVPNGMIYAGTITNFSALPARRIDLEIGASGEEIQRAREVLLSVLKADSRVLESPAPEVLLLDLAGPNVHFAVRPWVANADYWTVRADLLEQLKHALEQHSIAPIPPQQLVRLLNQA